MAFRKTRERSNHINDDRILTPDNEATFARQPRFFGFPFLRKRPRPKGKEKVGCEDPTATEPLIYTDYGEGKNMGDIILHNEMTKYHLSATYLTDIFFATTRVLKKCNVSNTS